MKILSIFVAFLENMNFIKGVVNWDQNLPLKLLHVFGPLKKWYFVIKLFCPTVRKNCTSDQDFFLKFEDEGQEFAKILKLLGQLIQTVKGQNNFG